jgi:hypothetical protein
MSNLWQQIKDEIRVQLNTARAFIAFAGTETNGRVTIRRVMELTAGSEQYARLAGSSVGNDAEVICLPVGGKPVILGPLLRSGSSTHYNVQGFGARGDGTTNDSAAINAAITAADTAGGGIVYLPPGTYIASGIVIPSNVWIMGAGVDATTVFLPSAANAPVMLTEDFATHTGTNDTDSPVNFKVSDLTIDGNKANNVSGSPNGYGIRIHGANFSLERLRVSHCNIHGIDTEWSNSASVPTTPGMIHAMEARINDVEIHDCASDGLSFNGPHDSMITNCINWENGGRNFYIGPKGGSSTFVACHGWGNDASHAWYLDGASGTHLIGCIGEGASTEQVYVDTANDVEIRGGLYFAAGGGAIGIHLDTCAGCRVDTQVLNCTTGAMKFTSDAGLHLIDLLAYQTSGNWVTGSPSGSSEIRVAVYGGGGAAQIRHHSGLIFMGSGDVSWRVGTGSPEGAVSAAVGSLYTRTDGGAGTTLYVKQTGSGNTGWAAK